MSIKLLFFAGSARTESVNKKLAKVAYDYAVSKGVEATFLDLKAYPLPLYDGDEEAEQGIPGNVIKLKKILSDHDGFLIASPEYNSMFSPLLKNMIDWCSRSDAANEDSLMPFKGKVAALAAASPGGLGGIRGLPVLRSLLQNISVMVVPSQMALGGAMKAFDDQGGLVDESQQTRLHGVVDQLIETTTKMKA